MNEAKTNPHTVAYVPQPRRFGWNRRKASSEQETVPGFTLPTVYALSLADSELDSSPNCCLYWRGVIFTSLRKTELK